MSRPTDPITFGPVLVRDNHIVSLGPAPKSHLPLPVSLATAVRDLKRNRLWLELTQRQVADTMGMTQSTLARLERGRTDPRLSTVVRYADALRSLMAERAN